MWQQRLSGGELSLDAKVLGYDVTRLDLALGHFLIQAQDTRYLAPLVRMAIDKTSSEWKGMRVVIEEDQDGVSWS